MKSLWILLVLVPIIGGLLFGGGVYLAFLTTKIPRQPQVIDVHIIFDKAPQ